MKKEELKATFEANMLDGDKVNDCGGAMLSAESVWEFIEEFILVCQHKRYAYNSGKRDYCCKCGEKLTN